MYASYFGLREKPFNATPDARFFYTNPSYREAYATLLYGIRERKGFITLTGEVGTGKTTLLRRLMENMDPAIKVVFLYNTTLEFEELVEFICGELKIPVSGISRVGRLQALNRFLLEEDRQGGTVVLLLDEAQNLSAATLENLRLISNLETATAKLLQIVLVGQPELEWKLADPALRQVTQRITVRHRLERLSDAEVEPFIDHRLRVMGRQRQDLFTDEAIRKLIPYVNGIPRLVNVVCDNALLVAYGMDAQRVTGAIIDEVIADLRLRAPSPPPTKPVSTARQAVGIERLHAPESGWATPPAVEPRSRWLSVSSAVLVGIGIAAIVSWGAPGLASLADWTLAWGRKLACATDPARGGPQDPDARRTQSAPAARAPMAIAPSPESSPAVASSPPVAGDPKAASNSTLSAPLGDPGGRRARPTPSVTEQMRRQRSGERLAEGRTVAPVPASSRQPAAPTTEQPSRASNLSSAPDESGTREAKAAAASQPPATTSESPRWNGAPIAPLVQAIVDVRPLRRPSLREESEAQPSSNRGFIVDGQGYIVTSDKISGAPSIEVTLHDGRVLGATVVARDRMSAVAILKVERRGLPALTLGDSGALAVGERVLIIGNGGGRDGTSSAGTVVATPAGSGGHLAVNLPSKPETVGGPLLNHRGHAVGIVTDIEAPGGGRQAVTLAVPVDPVKPLLANLKRRVTESPDRRERTVP